MIKTFAVAACAALVAAAAPAEAGYRWNGTTLNGTTLNGLTLNGVQFQGQRFNGAALDNASPIQCLPSKGGGCFVIVNGTTLNGTTLNGFQLNGAGGAVCSRVTNACWVNNGVALNGGTMSAPYWQNPEAAETAPVSSPTVQRLDPLAVRLANGELVQLAGRSSGGGYISNGPSLNGVAPRGATGGCGAPTCGAGGGAYINNGPALNGVKRPKNVGRYGETSSRGGGDWIINGPRLNGGEWLLSDGSVRNIRRSGGQWALGDGSIRTIGR